MPLKTYLINKTNNRRFRLDGLLRSSRLPEKKLLCQKFRQQMVLKANELPPKVDLRSDMTPVEDQSKLGSCAANCLAGAYEYLTKKSNGLSTDVSRLFIYYNARVKGNDSESIEDTGCSMTDAIEALEEFGTCLESIWPYDISHVNTRPNEQAYEQAKTLNINEALRVDIDLNEMKSCLAQGFPFVFGIELFSSFDKATQTGVVPMPNPWNSSQKLHGSHAMLAVGYTDQSEAFIVRNSWGEDWGDQGYCYIPYDYMTNRDFCFDAWTIRKLMNNDFSKEHWFFDDGINYLDSNTNRYFNDIDDDDDHIIEKLDENNDDNNDTCYNINHDIWCYDNNSRRTSYNNNTRRESYNNNSRRESYNKNPRRESHDCLDPYRNVERNYSINDVNYNDEKNQDNENSYIQDDFNSVRKHSNSKTNQYNNEENYYGGFLDFN
ncbi:unnamed protein product [Rotaria sp. Silwood2]|nr:unnamed protein product [Rotaria sp. Silwood2]CAF3113808.1 unnamed protein product [Rotaria sp. Silwood2]CAF4015506.1 unnamed protein product [Rotaria sp. Silwood2]CAF4509010.1 unnamed protein product [Rotaria sp. Silwood2]